MMLVSAYANGTTAGNPPPKRASYGGARGEVRGWSVDAVRRHKKWLYSINEPALLGLGFALTLTVRDCPPSADDWKRIREAFMFRMKRLGMVRAHWVTEWQRRLVPHMHMAIYFDPDDSEERRRQIIEGVYVAWLSVAADFRPGWRSQTVDALDNVGGWLAYLSKHAARGVAHYQRRGAPAGWSKTGRLWGHVGEWPVLAPMRFDMARDAGHRYRRMVRSWRIADAREALLRQQRNPVRDPKEQESRLRAARKRIAVARRMLACHDPKLSPVRGVSEFAGESVTLALVALLSDQGHMIVQRSE